MRRVDSLGGAAYTRFLGSAGGTFGRHGLQLSVTHSDGDGRRTNRWNQQNVNARWSFSGEDGIAIRTNLSLHRSDRTGTPDQTPEEYRARDSFNPYPMAFSTAEVVRLSAAIEGQAGSSRWSVTPYLRYIDTDMVPGWQLSYNPVVWDVDSRTAGVLAQARWVFPGLRADLVVGADGEITPGTRREPTITPVPTTDSEGREVWNEWSLTAAEPRYDYEILYRGAAGYAQAEWTPVETLRLSAGARYDLAGYRYTNGLSDVQTGSFRRPADTDVSYTRLTPKLGASWDVTPSTTLYGSWRRGFRVPLESQLFKQGSSANTVDLKPIDVAGSEVGVRTRIGARLRAEVAAYHMRLSNDILGYRAPDGVTAATNNGETLHRGAELTLAAALLRDLSLDLSYGFAEHTFEHWRAAEDLDLSGYVMDGAPRHTGSAYLTWAPRLLGGGNLSVEGSAMSGYWVDQANTKWEPGYAVVHLRGSHVVRGVEIFARLMNVSDRLHAAQAFDGWGSVDRYYSPGEPRTLYLGAHIRHGGGGR